MERGRGWRVRTDRVDEERGGEGERVIYLDSAVEGWSSQAPVGGTSAEEAC